MNEIFTDYIIIYSERFYFFISLSISFLKFLANVLENEATDMGASLGVLLTSDRSVNFFIPKCNKSIVCTVTLNDCSNDPICISTPNEL